MRNWVQNRWLDALLKFFALWAIVHAVLLIIGAFTGPAIGALGFKLIWAHWTATTFFNYFISISVSVITYFIIFCLFSHDVREEKTTRVSVAKSSK